MSLRCVDLNLLPILDALLRESSVSAAARRLNLSQPATSHALNRLRHVLNDPLLVRVGRDMRRTARAEALRPLCEAACAAIDAVVANEIFDPGVASRSFSVATPDHLALLLGQELMPLLRARAPGVSVRFIDVGLSVRDQLVSGDIDMAAFALIPDVVEGLSHTRGYPDQLVCVAAPGHPLASQNSVDWDELSLHPRLEIDSTPHFLIPAAPLAMVEPVTIAASHVMVMPLLAARAGSIAVVPRSLATLATQLAPLVMIEMTAEAQSMDYCLAWNPIHESDQAHQWLRTVLGDILENAFPITDAERPLSGCATTGS